MAFLIFWIIFVAVQNIQFTIYEVEYCGLSCPNQIKRSEEIVIDGECSLINGRFRKADSSTCDGQTIFVENFEDQNCTTRGPALYDKTYEFDTCKNTNLSYPGVLYSSKYLCSEPSFGEMRVFLETRYATEEECLNQENEDFRQKHVDSGCCLDDIDYPDGEKVYTVYDYDSYYQYDDRERVIVRTYFDSECQSDVKGIADIMNLGPCNYEVSYGYRHYQLINGNPPVQDTETRDETTAEGKGWKNTMSLFVMLFYLLL